MKADLTATAGKFDWFSALAIVLTTIVVIILGIVAYYTWGGKSAGSGLTNSTSNMLFWLTLTVIIIVLILWIIGIIKFFVKFNREKKIKKMKKEREMEYPNIDDYEGNGSRSYMFGSNEEKFIDENHPTLRQVKNSGRRSDQF